MLVALSGGPDSTALLHLLEELRPAFGWHLAAAHYDHGLRAGGRERERRLRERLDGRVPLLVGRPDRAPSPDHAALRRTRYAWLRDAADEARADRVATAHQLDDQAETVLFRILRGTGNRGLAGIPARRGRLVRPLLPFPRAELEAWLAARGADPFDDPSNRDPRYARTRIRHRLLPALEEAAGPGIAERLVAIAGAAGAVERCVASVAGRALEALAAGDAAEWPAELRAEALRLAGRRRGVRLRRTAARRAAETMLELTSGHGLDLGGGLRLEREFDRFTIRGAGADAPPDRTVAIEAAAVGGGEVRLAGRRRRIRWGPEAVNADCAVRVALHVQGDHFPLTIRARAPGDRIRLVGGTRKLGALMSEARVPAGERSAVPVVADRTGRILAVLCRKLAHRLDRDARGETNPRNLVIEVEDG